MSDCTCTSCANGERQKHPRTWLLQMQTDDTGVSALARLPPGRHWLVLGTEDGVLGGYQLYAQWSGKNVQLDVVPNGLHSSTLFPCFPDAFVYITGAANTLFLIAVTE